MINRGRLELATSPIASGKIRLNQAQFWGTGSLSPTLLELNTYKCDSDGIKILGIISTMSDFALLLSYFILKGSSAMLEIMHLYGVNSNTPLYLQVTSQVTLYTYVSVRAYAKSNMSNSSSDGLGNMSKCFCSNIRWHVEHANVPSHAPEMATIG